MLQQDNLEQHSSPAKIPASSSASATEARGFRGWVLGHYRFLYAADLILLYLSAMFYMMARVVTGPSSAASRTLLVLVIGSGIIAALPFVTGKNFENDFAFALANPGSKKRKRIEIAVAAVLVLILAAVVVIAIFHPAHHVPR